MIQWWTWQCLINNRTWWPQRSFPNLNYSVIQSAGWVVPLLCESRGARGSELLKYVCHLPGSGTKQQVKFLYNQGRVMHVQSLHLHKRLVSGKHSCSCLDFIVDKKKTKEWKQPLPSEASKCRMNLGHFLCIIKTYPVVYQMHHTRTLWKPQELMQTQELTYESSGNIQKDNVSAYQSW